jgi:hypothetical protein
MSGFVLMDAAEMGGVSILYIDPPAGDAAPEDALDAAGHGGAGLPCPDDLDAIEIFEVVFTAAGCEGAAVEFQVTEDGFLRVGCGQCGSEDLEGVFFHGRRRSE